MSDSRTPPRTNLRLVRRESGPDELDILLDLSSLNMLPKSDALDADQLAYRIDQVRSRAGPRPHRTATPSAPTRQHLTSSAAEANQPAANDRFDPARLPSDRQPSGPTVGAHAIRFWHNKRGRGAGAWGGSRGLCL